MLTNEALQPQKEGSTPPKSNKRPRPNDPPQTRNNRNRRSPSPNHYTPLNRSRAHILEYVRREGYQITEPRRLNPELADHRRRDRYCLFHRDYGHDTEFCQQLKQEIEKLIKRGHLKRFIHKESEGREAPVNRRAEEAPKEEHADAV